VSLESSPKGSIKRSGIRVIRGRSASRVEESWSVAGKVPATWVTVRCQLCSSDRLKKRSQIVVQFRKLEVAKGEVSAPHGHLYWPIQREARALIAIVVFFAQEEAVLREKREGSTVWPEPSRRFTDESYNRVAKAIQPKVE
jgi:hypothetical protein